MNNSKAENQSSPDRTAQRSNQGRERPIQILLIEDDPVYAELLQDLLINKNRNQWQLEVTTFLREGLEQLKRRPFDVVLADLYLPDSRGLDTVTGLLHVTELPVVVLTNMDNSNLALEAMRQGAQDYLLKGELSYRLLEKSIHYAIERSHTQTLLRQNEQHFRMALENSPITVFNQDTDLRYTWSFNPMSEFPAEVALGKHDIDLFSAADAQRLTAIKHRVLTTGIKTREETFITIGGVVRYFDLNVEPLRNAMGEIVGITCACTDITNYKQAEEALRLANTELENRVQQRTEELLSFQDTLRQREAEFRALLENSPDIISRLDRQFRHVYINPIIEQVTGLPPQSFIGKTNQELGMPEDKVEQWDRALNQVFETGQEVVIEFDFASCDGIRYFQGCLVPERNQQGEVQTILGISRDITNLKHVESALRESEEKFRQLAENIQAVFWSFTPDRKEVIYISPAYEQIWGRSCDELELSDYFWEKAIYPDDCDRVLAKLPLLLEGKFDEEFRIVRPDGTIRWIHSRGFPIHNQRGEVYRIAGISWDINDKKQAELALQQLNQELELRVQQRTEALLESEARLQKLAAYAPGMLYQYVLHVDGTDAMLYGSPACQTIFEVEPEAVMENRNLLWSMVHPDDLQMLRDSIAESAQNLQPWHVEYRIITPSGQLKWLEATSQPEQQANGDMVWYGILNEISDRKQAEAALRESEEKFRQLAETIQEVFWLKGDDDQLLYVSPNYELIWGRSVQSLYQNHQEWCDSIHPDDHDRIMAANARKVENGYDQEYRMIRPDGEIRWIRDRAFPIFDAQGQVYRIAGIAEDISDRKQTEQALQKSQYFIQRVADTTPHLLYIYDLIEQRNVYVNPFVTTVLGYPVQDIQQMDSPLWLNLMHPDDRTELSNPLKQFDTAKDGDIIEREYRLRRADGEYRWLYSRDTVFSRTADGKPKQVLGTAQDITERKLAEAQLKASLQEKELLLKEVHHRVKNNLQVISSLFSLQSQYIDNPEILSLLMESKNRIRAMALIHEKLYQSWTFAKIDFASYIQTLTRNLFASYNISSNRISLCLDVSDVSLTLDDAIPCGLLINELVSNALKHAFPNQQSGEISLQFSLNSDDHFILTVKDNGVGLPPDFTLEQTNSLGMLLVKALSLQLRGHLETQNDNGAVFKVTFPQPKDCNPF